MTRDDLLAALTHDNVAAFLRVIREGESNQNQDAYNLYFGGEHFESFADHPRQTHTRGSLTSSAAGAYQFLSRTWDGLVKQYHFPDFSPINQDCGAVALIAGRGALQSVLQGDLNAAIRVVNKEWASLPESPYGQPVLTFARAREVFIGYGGQLVGGASSPSSSPVPSFTPTPITQEVKHMPIFMALLPSILQALPQLAQVFGTDESARAHNTAAISVVSDALVKATASPNLQAAVESLSDPAKLAAAQAAIADIWPSITEVGGGIADARKTQTASDGLPFTKQGVFWITVGLLPLVYIIVLAAIGKWEYIGDITSETRAQVIGTVLGTILGGIVGYFYGTSAGSQRKTDVLAAK